MGSAVNLGSRLETLTRQLQADTLTNARTRELVLGNSAFSFDDMGHMDIKGFSQSIQVYALHSAT
jgi:class 3 adenylate cyclase